jgi:hypothetical protein
MWRGDVLLKLIPLLWSGWHIACQYWNTHLVHLSQILSYLWNHEQWTRLACIANRSSCVVLNLGCVLKHLLTTKLQMSCLHLLDNFSWAETQFWLTMIHAELKKQIWSCVMWSEHIHVYTELIKSRFWYIYIYIYIYKYLCFDWLDIEMWAEHQVIFTIHDTHMLLNFRNMKMKELFKH